MLNTLIKYMPDFLGEEILKIGREYEINEIRIRSENKIIYICKSNVLTSAYVLSKKQITNIVMSLTDFCYYGKKEYISMGYFTLQNGIRIGICGNCISKKGRIKNYSDYTSINVRIPSRGRFNIQNIIDFLTVKGRLGNILIIGAPGCGKTTFLKDLTAYYSRFIHFEYENICVVDKREEMMGLLNCNVDIISGCNHKSGVECAIKSMCSSIVFLDELESVKIAKMCKRSGLRIAATIHGTEIPNNLRCCGVFDRFVRIGYKNKQRSILSIEDSNSKLLYCQ